MKLVHLAKDFVMGFSWHDDGVECKGDDIR